jgi:hypothetical protein
MRINISIHNSIYGPAKKKCKDTLTPFSRYIQELIRKDMGMDSFGESSEVKVFNLVEGGPSQLEERRYYPEE